MKNPLVETVENELELAGIKGAKLIEECYDPKSFGNGEAIYEIRGIRFRFIRDRGQDGVDIIMPKTTESFIFEDLSLAMGWQQLSEVLESSDEVDFDKPPSGPIALRVVLEYIGNGLSELEDAFSKENIASTLVNLQNAQAMRTKAMFG